MDWTYNNYPEEMKDLNPRTREKAIEILNRLLAEGNGERMAIHQAISGAEEWFYESEG